MMVVTEHKAGDEFLDLARGLLEVLSESPGFLAGRVGRSGDDPAIWVVVTTWVDVGSMRRGYGSFDARVAAAPVMTSAAHRVSAFEVLLQAEPGSLTVGHSDRAPQ